MEIRPGEVEALRELVRRAVEDASVRRVALEMGVTHSWVHKFIHTDGSIPIPRVMRKLRAWAARQQEGGREKEVAQALDVLLRDVPEEHQAPTRELFLKVIAQLAPEPPPPVRPQRRRVPCRICSRPIPLNNMPQHLRTHGVWE